MTEGDNSVTGVYTYQRDGKLIAEGMYSMNGRQIPIKLSGGWEIKDRTLVSTIKETNVPEMLPVGTVTKDRILEIEEAGFRYYNDDSVELEIRTRVFKSGAIPTNPNLNELKNWPKKVTRKLSTNWV